MDDDNEKVRKAAELVNEAAGVALAAMNPWTFGRKVVELLLRLERKEPIPGLPEYMLEYLNDLWLDVRAHNERLFALESDRGKTIVLGNLSEAAWREANDERRRMLANASAALILSVELSVAELARVERTIRQLDPEDLVQLRALADLEGDVHGRPLDAADPASARVHLVGVPDALYRTLTSGHLEGAALIASGCVRVGAAGAAFDTGIAQAAYMTALGRLVLRFMGRSG